MIELRDVRFRYSSDSPEILKGINTTIPDGSFVGLMGSNGSGKSTLARCLNGLLIPSSGSVTVDGLKTNDLAVKHEVRKKVGLVFQDPNLQMTSVTIEHELAFGLENIRMAHNEMHERVREFLRVFRLEDRKDDSPSSLSGGEKQRLAIASILILTPSYLVLDEATSLLSTQMRVSILNEVAELRRKMNISVLLITQYPSEALLCNRLLILHEGRIEFDDRPDRVFSNGRVLLQMGVSIPIAERLKVSI